MANVTIPKQTMDFSQTSPNGFGTQNKQKTHAGLFLQKISLLQDRTFLWKLTKDFEAWGLRTDWETRDPPQKNLDWVERLFYHTSVFASSTLPQTEKPRAGSDLGELVLFLSLPLPIPALAYEIGDARGGCEMAAFGSEANLKSRLQKSGWRFELLWKLKWSS